MAWEVHLFQHNSVKISDAHPWNLAWKLKNNDVCPKGIAFVWGGLKPGISRTVVPAKIDVFPHFLQMKMSAAVRVLTEMTMVYRVKYRGMVVWNTTIFPRFLRCWGIA